jgi:SOS-response transcriptional repressor LexA
MSNSPISRILKALMFKKNINASGLARNLDLPQQTLQRIVSGISPNPHKKTLGPIADFFQISVEQLKGKQPLPPELVKNDLQSSSSHSLRQLPILPWKEIDTYLDEETEFESLEHIAIEASLPENTFVTRLDDSSMEPYFPKSSILIFSAEDSAKDSDFVLVKLAISNNHIFRQLITDGEHRYLKPLNPDLTSSQIRLLNKEDEILGIMLEFRYKYTKT